MLLSAWRWVKSCKRVSARSKRLLTSAIVSYNPSLQLYTKADGYFKMLLAWYVPCIFLADTSTDIQAVSYAKWQCRSVRKVCATIRISSGHVLITIYRDNHFLMESHSPLGAVLVVTAFNFPHAVSRLHL